MMRKFALLLCIAVATVPAWGSDIGTSVSGSFTLANEGSTNYFDPTNLFVPAAGYLNSVSCGAPDCNVKISSSTPTFAYDDGVNTFTADFSSGNQLIISSVNEEFGATNGFSMTFTDTAFTSASKISDSFRRGGLNLSFSADTITLSYTLGAVNATSRAVFNIGTATVVPEPSTGAAILFGTFLTGFAVLRRRVA